VQKKTIIGHGIEKSIDDIKLTRYACYLIALNSDPRKEQATIEEVYEPYLLQLGLLDRTSRGRVATKKAWKHLNIKSEGKLL
jgi:Holliday junction resolvasome RuvABC ATP-dependent DNA helicase subunit